MILGLLLVALGLILWTAFGRFPRQVLPAPAAAG
jgi:hypothetical protein